MQVFPMSAQFTAVVEHGLLRPLEPIALEDGATVEVVVLQTGANVPAAQSALRLAAIAALPTSGGDPNTSRDHDAIIYGERRAP
jgi:predicted DNA-binding antitoxin AbrB/MazE fold protein